MQNAECRVKRSINELRHCARATALIETAIVLPLYMILLFGLLYFGYATLGRQRQDKASAYAAWEPGTQQASDMLTTFWGSSQPVYTTFSVYGGGELGPGEWVRHGDEYYGMQKQGAQWLWPGSPNYNVQYNNSDDITGNVITFVPYQLGSFHQISNGGGDFFDSERVAVDLWNYALGSVTQSFNWVPGQGIVQQFIRHDTDFSRYLNLIPNPQGGLLYADDGDPPRQNLATPPGWGGLLANALSYPAGVGQQQWLQRRAVESTMTYNDPLFLRYAYADQGAPPSTFGQYISGNNTAPANTSWMTATMDCDVTVRNPASVRLGAEEGEQSPAQFLSGVSAIIGENGTLPAPPLDTLALDASGNSIQYWWTPQ